MLQLKKILFAAHRFALGGADRIMLALADHFAQKGYETHVLTYEDADIPYRVSDKIIFHSLTPTRMPRGIRRLVQIGQLRKGIKAVNPDMVVSFFVNVSTLVLLALQGTGIPVVISERADPQYIFGITKWLRDATYPWADGYVFQTEAAKKYYPLDIQKRSVVIPNPIASRSIPEPWSGVRKKEIVSIGRLTDQKNQNLMIKAFAEISDEFPDITLVIYGEGELRPALEELVRTSGLDGRVKMPGTSREIHDEIKAARMFVLSSDYEGIPNALIEAMAMGLPVISTNYSPGCVNDLISSGENGIIVHCSDVNALADAMRQILRDPQAAERMGHKAREIYNRLAPEKIFPSWEEFFLKIYNSRSALKSPCFQHEEIKQHSMSNKHEF
jgi:glycosyltransferase involved in cell wall biosynthesis